jgi:hypothetical protein
MILLAMVNSSLAVTILHGMNGAIRAAMLSHSETIMEMMLGRGIHPEGVPDLVQELQGVGLHCDGCQHKKWPME